MRVHEFAPTSWWAETPLVFIPSTGWSTEPAKSVCEVRSPAARAAGLCIVRAQLEHRPSLLAEWHKER